MKLKENYAMNHSKINEKSLFLNKRLFNTYNRIVLKKLNKILSGVNVDLGSGDGGFGNYLKSINIESYSYDYPSYNIEKDSLKQKDGSVDFITMNAVIEHINNTDNIFNEIGRVLKNTGLIFVRTPNFRMDYRNFYNDPTHVKPYTPIRLKNTFKMYDLETIFLEPGLVEKSWFWWQLPDKIKWLAASLLNGGTKSIIGIAIKK